MSKEYKPKSHTKCIECGKPVYESEEYYYSKAKGCPPVFIHKECYVRAYCLAKADEKGYVK